MTDSHQPDNGTPDIAEPYAGAVDWSSQWLKWSTLSFCFGVFGFALVYPWARAVTTIQEAKYATFLATAFFCVFVVINWIAVIQIHRANGYSATWSRGRTSVALSTSSLPFAAALIWGDLPYDIVSSSGLVLFLANYTFPMVLALIGAGAAAYISSLIIEDRDRHGWFLGTPICVLLTVLSYLIISSFISSIGPLTVSASWELAALLVTAAVCLYLWLDIWTIGENKIRPAMEPARSGWFLGMAGLTFVLLLAAVLFALAPWTGDFERLWQRVEFHLGPEHWYTWHAFALLLGAGATATLSGVLSCGQVINPMFERRVEEDNDVKDAVEALRKEIKASRRALFFADIPACVAFLAIFITVGFVCFNEESMSPSQLKSFIGGSVAMSLVLTNAVHVSLRLRNWSSDE